MWRVMIVPRFIHTTSLEMAGIHSEIIVLIDTSAFANTEWNKTDLIDHVKEAVSFQISRGAVTNRKLIKLGLEPYLARVKWTYVFFDSTQNHSSTAESSKSTLGQSMKTLTYECWDLFEEELNREAKRNSSGDATSITAHDRVKNVIQTLHTLRFPYIWPGGSTGSNCRRSNSNPDLDRHNAPPSSPRSLEKFIIVFTLVPKAYFNLVHLASGIENYRRALFPVDTQICFVDLSFDYMALQMYHGIDRYLSCFWDDICCVVPPEAAPGKKISLRVSCLKKIMMIHKLMEMRFPWRYDQSLPFGFGLGMKRLRHWEWKIPEESTNLQRARKSSCFSLRKCYSEEMYCGHFL